MQVPFFHESEIMALDIANGGKVERKRGKPPFFTLNGSLPVRESP
jgi:hypothetical protein